MSEMPKVEFRGVSKEAASPELKTRIVNQFGKTQEAVSRYFGIEIGKDVVKSIRVKKPKRRFFGLGPKSRTLAVYDTNTRNITVYGSEETPDLDRTISHEIGHGVLLKLLRNRQRQKSVLDIRKYSSEWHIPQQTHEVFADYVALLTKHGSNYDNLVRAASFQFDVSSTLHSNYKRGLAKDYGYGADNDSAIFLYIHKQYGLDKLLDVIENTHLRMPPESLRGVADMLWHKWGFFDRSFEKVLGKTPQALNSEAHTWFTQEYNRVQGAENSAQNKAYLAERERSKKGYRPDSRTGLPTPRRPQLGTTGLGIRRSIR